MPLSASTLRTGPHAVSLFHHVPALFILFGKQKKKKEKEQGHPSPPELPRYKVASYLSIKRLLGCLVLWPGPLLITRKGHSKGVLRGRGRGESGLEEEREKVKKMDTLRNWKAVRKGCHSGLPRVQHGHGETE